VNACSNTSRWVALATAVICAGAVTACGSSSKSGTSPTTSSSATAPSGTTASTSSGGTFKLGVELSLSGPLGPVGQLVEQGAKVWLKAHAGATIDGKTVQVYYVDDLATAVGGASAARQLVDEDHVSAVVGPFDSDAAEGSLPLFKQAGVIDVPLTAYEPAHTPSQFPNSFPVQFGDNQSSTLTLLGAQQVHSTKVGVLSTDDALGSQLQSGITSTAGSIPSLKIVSTQQYPDNPTDLTTQVQKVQSAGADSIIVNSIVLSDYTVIFKALAALNYHVPVIGGSPAATPTVLNSIPAAYVKELYVTSIVKNCIAPLSPTVTAFVKLWTQDTGAAPITTLGTLAPLYDAISVVQWGYNGAGSTSAASVEAYIDGQGSYSGVLGTYTFTSSFRGLQTDQAGTAQAASLSDGTFTAGFK
jgi:branched-chain amino acid transport system substrate-binding protein